MTRRGGTGGTRAKVLRELGGRYATALGIRLAGGVRRPELMTTVGGASAQRQRGVDMDQISAVQGCYVS
jgi:hypothetical protein